MSDQDKARRGVEKMMDEAHDRQRAHPDQPRPQPTVDHEVFLPGGIESGVDDAGMPWHRSTGTHLICWTDGSVTWRE